MNECTACHQLSADKQGFVSPLAVPSYSFFRDHYTSCSQRDDSGKKGKVVRSRDLQIEDTDQAKIQAAVIWKQNRFFFQLLNLISIVIPCSV